MPSLSRRRTTLHINKDAPLNLRASLTDIMPSLSVTIGDGLAGPELASVYP